jgi:hypothetical protein
MTDAFLVYFLVTLLPIAFLGIGGHSEHVLFVGWRWLQVGTLLGVAVFTVSQLARRGWRDLVILVLVATGIGYLVLSYIGIAWDAQIEYNRVLQLADHFGSLTEGYRHGVTHWILGYPPGATLSVAFFLTLKMLSPNFAQGALIVLWSGSFLLRHCKDVDLPGKLVFFAMLATGAHMTWHLTYFYNNLFYALIWATYVLAPLLGSTLRPWERCAYALALVWLRPQWQIAAIPIATSALATVLSAPSWNWRLVRDTALVTLAALTVAWLGSDYWRRASADLDRALSVENTAVIAATSAHQDPRTLEVEVTTRPFEQQAKPIPKLMSKESVDAVAWAFTVTKREYSLSLLFLAGAALLALVALRRRGLAFLVPLLSPLGMVLGTAVFARGYAEYRANAWALERLQIITPILAAGVAAALHRALRRQGGT